MAQTFRLLSQTTLLLICAASLAAHANDNGHCRDVYAKAENELFKAQQSKRNESGLGAGLTAAFGVATAYSIKKNSAVAATIFGLGTLATYFVASNTRDEAQTLTAEYATKAFEARMVYLTYEELSTRGTIESNEAHAFVDRLAADPESERMMLKKLVEEMDSGDLCDGSEIKPIGKVLAQLKSAGAEARNVY